MALTDAVKEERLERHFSPLSLLFPLLVLIRQLLLTPGIIPVMVVFSFLPLFPSGSKISAVLRFSHKRARSHADCFVCAGLKYFCPHAT